MPLPVAHSLIGASVAAAIHGKAPSWWKLLCISAFLGVFPDFDYTLICAAQSALAQKIALRR